MGTTERTESGDALVIAILTAIAIELVRASGPALDWFFVMGLAPAAIAALATYAAPGLLIALLMVRRRAGGAFVAGIGITGGFRIAAAFTSGPVRSFAILLAVAFALATLTLAVAAVRVAPDGARRVGVGVALGLAAITGLQFALGTWDAIWQGGAVSWAVAAGWLVLIVVAVLLWPKRGVVAVPRHAAGLGVALALGALVVANPAFVAAQTGLGIAWTLSLLPCLVAGVLWAVASVSGRPTAAPLAGALVVAGAAGSFYLSGPFAALPIAVLVIALPPAVAAGQSAKASETTETRMAPLVRAGVATGLAAILPILGYQIFFDLPIELLGGPLIVIAAAIVLAWPSFRPGETAPAARESLAQNLRLAIAGALGLATALTVVGILVHLPRHVDVAEPGQQLKAMTWNLHYGVANEPSVALGEQAKAIEDEDADVVAVQEVSRGWILGGGADMASWLGWRLGWDVAYGAAADRQFGSALLSPHPLTDVDVENMAGPGGPLMRASVSATIETTSGPLRVTSVHLHHLISADDRVAQLTTISQEQGEGAALIMGDFNVEPGSPETVNLESDGWTSALAADPSNHSWPTWAPEQQIDYIWARGAAVADGRLTPPAASDHIGVTATISMP